MLEARNVSVLSAAGRPLLDGVTVLVSPGEAVALVGPRGSGKTLLLRAIAGLAPVHAGVISLAGIPFGALSPHRRARRRLVFVPQRWRPMPARSVRDNLLVGAWLLREPARVEHMLRDIWERFPALAAVRRRPAGTLSPGPAAMLRIARGVMADPTALLLDEPLAGLDAGAAAAVGAIVRELRARDALVLSATEEIREAPQIADRVYGLRGGRVVFSGSVAALSPPATVRRIYG